MVAQFYLWNERVRDSGCGGESATSEVLEILSFSPLRHDQPGTLNHKSTSAISSLITLSIAILEYNIIRSLGIIAHFTPCLSRALHTLVACLKSRSGDNAK